MSRSNGPLNQGRGVPPQHWPTPEEDAEAAQGYHVPQQPGRYPQPPVYQPAPETRAPQQYYKQPVAPSHAQPQAPAYNPAAPQQPSYQPQFDRYAPAEEPQQRQYDPRALQQLQRPAYPQPSAPQPAQASLYDAHMAQAHAQQAHAQHQATPVHAQSLQAQVLQAQAHAAAQAAQAAQAQPPRGYDQWPQGTARPQTPAAANPAREYDFSNYAPAGSPPQPQRQDYARPASPEFAAAPGQQPYPNVRQPTLHPQAGHPAQAQPDQQWQLNPGYDQRGEPSFDPNQRDDYEQAEEEHRKSLQAAGDQGFDQDDQYEYEDEEPRKGRRGLVMVSALVGAIALGGGMAYGYKTYMKPSSSSAVVGKVSAPKGPAKTAPAEAGGKQFPNQDSKLAGRLGDGSAPAVQVAEAPPGPTPSMASPDLEGVKRVPTVVVGRDGTIGAPQPVPGMMIQQPPVRPPQPVTQVQAAEAAPPAPVVPRARVADIPPPRQPTAIVNSVTAEPPPPAAAPVKRTPAKKPPGQRDDLVASGTPSSGVGAAPVPVTRKTGTSGYVAVVASKGSRADAEKANADLEQRFDVLKGKVFDVQEADLSAQGKGMVYRSVVGPPGSRAFASGVCSQLKAVGYSDCWPTAY